MVFHNTMMIVHNEVMVILRYVRMILHNTMMIHIVHYFMTAVSLVVERSPRMREIWVRFLVGTHLIH